MMISSERGEGPTSKLKALPPLVPTSSPVRPCFYAIAPSGRSSDGLGILGMAAKILLGPATPFP
jgi:hypothetical protein